MAHLTNGGLAQLVERLLCKQDVNGSSPLTSTGTEVPLLNESDWLNSATHLEIQESLLNLDSATEPRKLHSEKVR